MSKLEKAIKRLKSVPKDYTYSEAKYLLGQLGFIESNKGRTSGSRVKFVRFSDGAFVLLHKPHPSSIMSAASVRDMIFILKELGEIE